MKRLIKKNQVIITVLAVMIAVAGYLNYSGRLLEKEADQMTTGNNTILLTAEEDNTSLAEEGTYVDIISLDGDDSEEVSAGDVLEESADSGVPGEAVLASVSTTDALISQAKLNREQVRAKNKETLLEVINNENITEEQKQAAVANMTSMADSGGADRGAAGSDRGHRKEKDGCGGREYHYNAPQPGDVKQNI